MRPLEALWLALTRPALFGLIYLVRGAMAVLVARLCLGAFSPEWLMALPGRDRSVFEPGLDVLARLLGDNRATWSQLAAMSPWVVALAGLVSAVLVTFLLHALDRRQSIASVCRATVRSAPAQVLLVAVFGFAVVLVVVATQRLMRTVPALAYPAVGEKGADAVLLLLALLLVVTIVAIRIAGDLVRAGMITSEQPVFVVVSAALSDLRARWRFWAAGYLCLCVPRLLLPLLGEWWFPTFGSAPVFGFWPAVTHQLTIAVQCVLQLSWWVMVRTHGPVPARPESWRTGPKTRSLPSATN